MKRLLALIIITTFLFSPKGIDGQTNWTLQNSGTTALLLSVTWTGSQLVAVGRSGTILTSTDGIIWTQQTSGTTRQLYFVSYSNSNGKVFVVGDNGTILSSSDGIAWTNQTSGTTKSLVNVIWTDSEFVTLSSYSSPSIILTSPDGITWTSRYSSDSVYSLNSITVQDSLIVVVGTNVNGRDAVILTSLDGITWVRQNSVTIDSCNGLSDIKWTGSNFVAVGINSDILTSTDGFVWARRSCKNTGAVGFNLISIDLSDSLLTTVGVGEFGLPQVHTSSDGITWTERSVSSGYGLNVVRWLGNNFIAVGNSGTIITSSDGTAWINRTSGTSNDLNSIAFTGSLYVVVGNGGTILTSPLDPTGTIPRHDNTKPQQIFLNHSGGVFTYSLPSREFVEIGVYTVSGKKIAVLEQGYKSAGEHTATFTKGMLPIGVYVYRFRAGSYKESGRVMMTK